MEQIDCNGEEMTISSLSIVMYLLHGKSSCESFSRNPNCIILYLLVLTVIFSISQPAALYLWAFISPTISQTHNFILFLCICYFKMFLFLCINVCLHTCICTRCMSDAHRGQKMASDLPELKLQMV